MCTVQVMLFADVMRSPDRLRSSGGVCRKLFSNDTSASSAIANPSVFLKTMEAQLRQRDMARWNFDFQREIPLPGRYQWEAVGRPVQALNAAQTNRKSDENTDEEVVVVEEVKRTQSSIPATKAKARSSAGVTTQAKITDFLSKRKRHHPEDTISSKKLRRLESHTSLSTTPRTA